MRKHPLTFLAGSALTLLPLCLSCAGERAQGLAATERKGGPQVVYDIEATPLPEIPLPNDAAMRLDPTSPTGRRINVGTQAPTELEREVRQKFNRLDGFGTFAPITVRFSAPIDVADLHERHNANDDFRDDAIFLLNVDKRCRRYGEEVALDIGRGRYPVVLYTHSRRVSDPQAPLGYRIDDGGNTLFDNDPRGDYNNLLFEERNEDRNGNGRLDSGEDLDGDGMLDVANFVDPTACDGYAVDTVEYDRCVADHLMTYYERETNTLIARPVWPLEERCEYAMVLSKRIVDAQGRPVESPFPAVHHVDQTETLAPVAEFLPRYGLGLSDIGFAWTFTTGSQTKDLESLRAGLYGHGKFERLAQEFPVESLHVWTMGELSTVTTTPNEKRFKGACGAEVINRFWSYGIEEWEPNRCSIEAVVSAVGGFFGGTFDAPNLLADKDGVATEKYPHDDDEIWEIDAMAGTATYGKTKPTFWCVMPREEDTSCSPGNPEGKPFCKPFPVALYAHGYGGSRAEIFGFLGQHATMGIAVCSLDAYGHGLNRISQDLLAAVSFGSIVDASEQLGTPGLLGLATLGRDRDLDNDGKADSGGDMWSADIFHTRDMVRQSVLETMQFVRILRSMDGKTKASDGSILGDVDGDGKPDIGGPENTIGMWGISLGGVITGVAAGAEPSMDAASPNAGGAGLTDIAVRSKQAGVPEEVHLPVAGPFIAGCLPTDEHQALLPKGSTGKHRCWETAKNKVDANTLSLAFMLHATARYQTIEFAQVEGVEAGDLVQLENLDNGEKRTVRIDERGRFRVAVAADALTPTERRPLLGLADEDTSSVTVTDTPSFGDRLRLSVMDGHDNHVKSVVDSFGSAVLFQGTEYAEGAPLVALQQGLALERNTPAFRRFLGLAQHAMGPADPGVWAAHYVLDPLDVSAYDPHVASSRMHALVMPTLGDRSVPVNTGIAMGRAAGLFGSWLRDEEHFGPETGYREIFAPDARYGKSVDQELVDRYVIEGLGRLQRYATNPINPNVLYDIDDVSDGNASYTCGPSDWSGASGENDCPSEVEGQEVFFGVPHPEPGKALRQNRMRGDGSFDAFRVPMLRPAGQHGIYNPQPFRVFDADAYMVDFTIRFLATRGKNVNHESGCDCSAPALGHITVDGVPQNTALQGTACSANNLKLCSPACASAWGMKTPPEAACMP